MKPGRELDALVAREVMGWTQVSPRYPGSTDWVGRPPGSHLLDKQEIPCFSKLIAAAWLVAEKLQMTVGVPGAADGGNCTLGNYTAICWGKDRCQVYEWGESAPHAICLAALRAVGVSL